MAHTTGDDDLSGIMLGRYELRERLGKGGMGAVYLAFDTSHLQRLVALKVLSSELAAQSNYRERFEREAKIAASLEHSHIVPVYDSGTVDARSFIVMRLLTGNSLDWRVKHDNPLSLEKAARLLEQLASALDHAHSKGVVHRDVKGSNVVFDDKNIPFLVDFGIAKLIHASANLTAAGHTLGTYTHMAPERWEGGALTPAADQYALAVTIYAALAGRVPFEPPPPDDEDDNLVRLMLKHLHEPPPPVQNWRPELPDSINQVLQKAMAKRPQARYESAEAFAEAFRQAADLPIPTPPPIPPVPPPAPLPDTDTELIPVPLPPTPPPVVVTKDSKLLAWLRTYKGLLSVLVLLSLLTLVVLRNNIINIISVTPTQLQTSMNQTETAQTIIVAPTTETPTPTHTETVPPSRVPSETASRVPTDTPSDRPTAIVSRTPAATATGLTLVCPFSPPSRLTVGGMARVVEGQPPNIIREASNSASTRLGEISSGQIVTVLDGPQCGPTVGRTWWQISYRGLVGWTTEGSGDTYFLEPVSGTPSTIAPTTTDTPWPVPSTFVTPVRQTISGALAHESDSMEYTFVWQRGSAVSIELESVEFDTYLTLEFPDGSLLTDDDSAGELDSRIGPVELPADGTYTIRVTTFNQNYGDYTLTYTDYSVCGHLPIAIVKAGGVNLRAGPNIFDPVQRSGRNGECLAIAGRSADGEWLQVYTTSGQTAWISASVVDVIGDLADAPIVNE